MKRNVTLSLLSAVAASALIWSGSAVAAPVAAEATGTSVQVGKIPLGNVLVDDQGMTLYMYTKDKGGESACYDQCAAAWPPLLTEGAPVAGKGVSARLLGTTTRKDGKMQVTYKGLPLYYWIKDKAAGDWLGQDVGTVWYVLAPNGRVIKTTGTKVQLGENVLGKVLVDAKGKTLYMFAKDADGTSNCYDKCAIAWPPLLTKGAPHGLEGINAQKLGMTKRKDGKLQVTYGGMPLYYWAQDKKAGDWLGQDVGSVWYMVSGDGSVLKTAGAKVNIGDTSLGKVLIDDKGMTLYMYTKDRRNRTNCYEECAVAWPPLITKGAPKVGEGADSKLLGVTKRKDGQLQVTYKGFPLYYWYKDSKVGDVTGQDVDKQWYVLSPAGAVIR